MEVITPHSFENSGAKPSPRRKDDITHKQVKNILTGGVGPSLSQPVDLSIFPVYYQRKIGACVSHAVTWILMFLDYLESQTVRNYTPRFNYALTKHDDNVAPDDQGTFPVVAINELINHGMCDDSLLPNDTTLPYETYKDMSLISQEAYTNALPRQANNQVIITDLSASGLRSALQEYKLLAVLIKVGAEMWTDINGNISWAEKDVLPLRPPQDILSGHEIVLLDSASFKLPIDSNLYFMNSWSDLWGRKGVGYFGQNYLPYIVEARALVDLPDAVVNNLLQQLSLAQKVVALLKQLLHIK